MLTRIKPCEAEIGMYVHRFEGTWLSHPFWRARFVISSQDDLTRVRGGGVDLLIDSTKSAHAAQRLSPNDADEAIIAPMTARSSSRITEFAPVSRRPTQAIRKTVAPQAFGKADRARAAALAERSKNVVAVLFEMTRLGQTISTSEVLEVVDNIAKSLELNKWAFNSVTRLRAKDDVTYTHSVSVCALMIGLARETGASPEHVQVFGTAGLLHDIGKVSIADAILKKDGPLTELEMAEIRRHPEVGQALLREEDGIPPVVIDACLHHHERLDGSGYPFGLKGESVSIAARMTAICDVYDAMTASRPYRTALSPSAALVKMEAAEGQFDSSLLFSFMRSIGIFPAGKLVRLRSNRLAVVLPAYRDDCRAVARAFYSTVDTHFVNYSDAVISDSLADDQIVKQEDPSAWFVDSWPEMLASIMSGKILPYSTERY